MISRLHLAALFTCVVSLDNSNNVNVTKNLERCNKFGVNPYFDPELMVGAPWRICYSWNVKLDECLDLTFKGITPWTVNRFWADMAEYLEEQPAWGAAVLYSVLSVGPVARQLLLFSDRGPAGRLYGVPYVRREPNFLPKKKSVPLLQFQMKLLRRGQYLVIMDCLGGVTSLSTRISDEPPDKAEIQSLVKKLGFGNGFPACKINKNG